MKLIYRKIDDYEYEQRYLQENTQIPEGWSIEKPTVEYQPSELEKLQRENEELKSRIDMNESTILELSDMMLGGM